MNGVTIKSPLRVVYFEETLRDRQLAAEALASGGVVCDFVYVNSREEFQAALAQNPCDLILSDLISGRDDGWEALAAAQTMRPEVPFVFVCGNIGEERAVECLKSGATDCVFKSRLERLAPAVRRAWSEAEARRARKQAQDEAGRLASSVRQEEESLSALRQSEQRLRLFIESAPVAIAMFDNQMRYLAVSQRWLQDYRLTRDVIGASHYDIFPEIPESWKQVHRRGLAGAVERSDEDRFVRSDGTVTWLKWEVRPWLASPSEVGGITIFTEDITERKQAQEALRENEERLRLVLQASSMGTFEVDLLTGEGRWNATEFELLGLKPGDAPPRPESFFRFVHPEDIGQVQARWEEALRVGKLDAEFRVVRADGELRWLAGKGQFVFEGKTGEEAPEARGRARFFLGVNFDITGRKLVEEALAKSVARFDGIIASAMDAVISIDSRQRIVLFNPAAEKMFGVPAREALGDRIDRFIPEQFRAAHPSHVEHFGETGVSPRKMGALGAVSGWRTSGEEFPIEASISQVEVSGEKLFTVILRDITERRRAEAALRESEQRYRLAQQVARVGTFEWNLQTGLTRWTRELEAMHGLAPGGFAGTQTAWQELVYPDDRAETGRWVQEAIDTGGVVVGEWRVVWPDGTMRWLAGRASVFKDPSGTPLRMIGVNIDITERKQAEQKLHASREQLRLLAAHLQAVREEERTRVAREIHDVLAQELTAIKVDVAWLNRRLAQPLDAEKQKLLQQKLAATMDLADAAIQSVQKIATGLRPVVLDNLGLCAAIEWQASDFQTTTEIRCEAFVPAEDISMDHDRSTALFRIVQESLTNAARHAQATRVEVRLRHEASELTLTVQDNGRGIRAGEVNDPHSLGLVGLRERALLLGGQCRITGKRGKGTTVEVRLPLPATGKPGEVLA